MTAHRSVAARWIEDSRDILIGLAALRRLGPAADDAVTVTMALEPMQRLYTAWELAAALADQAGVDLHSALGRILSAEQIDLLERALVGSRLRLLRSSTSA